MDVVVGRLGRPQGLRGEVTVEVRTDEPEVRLGIGAELLVRSADLGAPPEGLPATLTVSTARMQSGRLILGFDGFADRSAAERLRDVLVAVAVDPSERPADPEEFYDHQLVGLAVVTVSAEQLGAVVDVLHLPSQDVLVVRSERRGEVLIPFTAGIVPTVDLVVGQVVVDPPTGLLDPESTP